MPLVYVTGISGAGKSAIRGELIGMGYPAFGTDEDGYGIWLDKTTGEPAEEPDEPYDRHEWFSRNDWCMSRRRVEELSSQAGDRLVFLCGGTSTDSTVLDLLDLVVCLTIDEQTLRHRIARRTGNAFGQAPAELRWLLGWHRPGEDIWRGHAAVMVDATRPLAEVAAEVIQAARQRAGQKAAGPRRNGDEQ